MKEYQKPSIEILGFVSKEAISADTLEAWLNGKDFSDAGIVSYEVTSLGE